MDPILFHSIWTVVMLVLFIGIWAWAWSGKRKPDFDAAARLPLDDDAHGRMQPAAGRVPEAADYQFDTTRNQEKHNG